jgi:hypothetical protein
MKCKTFSGSLGEVEYAFNAWAKGKLLTRDIIIHSYVTSDVSRTYDVDCTIIVFYPEGSLWDEEPETPKQQDPKWSIPEIKINGKVEQL